MDYTVRYRNRVICKDVDRGSAKAICQLLLFLMNVIEIKIDPLEITVEYKEKIDHKKQITEFINN